MGADFFFNYLPAARLTDDRAATLRLLANAADLERDRPDGHYESDEEWREALLAALDDMALDYNRDVAWWSPSKDNPLKFPILLTGGLSWGDDPNESYRHMENLRQCGPIYELLLKWAKEDMDGAATPTAAP